jgi:hypothetical protein
MTRPLAHLDLGLFPESWPRKRSKIAYDKDPGVVGEAVTDPADGDDEVLAHLRAEPSDVDVDGPFARVQMAPDALEQLPPAEDGPWMLGARRQRED